MSTQYDTLIIGAGAAGLAAGRALAAAGQRVVLVEARGRIGGRIFTRRVKRESAATLPIELGAEFIHGLPEETWTLVREAGLATDELTGSSLVAVNGGVQKQGDSGDAVFEVLRGLENWAAETGKSDVSFAEYLQSTKIAGPDADAAARYVEGFNAADRNLIGAAGLAKQQMSEDANRGDRVFRVRAGYAAIPRVLATSIANAGSELLLQKRVGRVAWSPGSVAASGMDEHCQEFTVRARRAIVTLPLGVLQAGVVGFEPVPTRPMLHAARMRMGTAARVTLVFRSQFWREGTWKVEDPGLTKELERMSFLFTPRSIPSVWWTAMPSDAPTLTGWVGGPGAAEFGALERSSSGTDDALVRHCFRILSAASGLTNMDLARRLQSSHSHDWVADEFSRGAYSYVPAGALDAPEQLAAPVAATLYFAGEHTDTVGDWGTVHGALRSGLRAARQVLADAR